MKTIQQFHLNPGMPQTFMLPPGEVLSVKPEGGMINLFILVDQGPPLEYKFDCFLTGQPVPYDAAQSGKFIGSCALVDGRVYHVFQR